MLKNIKVYANLKENKEGAKFLSWYYKNKKGEYITIRFIKALKIAYDPIKENEGKYILEVDTDDISIKEVTQNGKIYLNATVFKFNTLTKDTTKKDVDRYFD